MRKIFLFLLTISVIASAKAQIKTPAASPSATVSQSIGLAKATIEYSRPSLKGRKMIGGDLVPYDKIWRTGANKIPNLILSEDVMIDGKNVPAGTYGIATIPGKTDWTIILTKNAAQWGVYEYKESEDLMRFKAKAQKTKSTEEHFTMGFSDFTPTSAHLFIAWENTHVKFKISQEPDALIMAEIKAKTMATEVTTDTYFGAANYYFENGKDLNQAMAWANKVVEKDKAYWTLALRAKIAQKLGKCDIAKADAKEGVELAKKDNDTSYVNTLTKILNTCK
jgi:Protein of unknown function (DUF2911)